MPVTKCSGGHTTVLFMSLSCPFCLPSHIAGVDTLLSPSCPFCHPSHHFSSFCTEGCCLYGISYILCLLVCLFISYKVKVSVPDTTLFVTVSFLTMAVSYKRQGVVKRLTEEKKTTVNCCEDGEVSPLCQRVNAC